MKGIVQAVLIVAVACGSACARTPSQRSVTASNTGNVVVSVVTELDGVRLYRVQFPHGVERDVFIAVSMTDLTAQYTVGSGKKSWQERVMTLMNRQSVGPQP